MNKQLEDIKSIKEMMEKSSKFLSLSGLSGVFAGSFALIGAAVAYFILKVDYIENVEQKIIIILLDAFSVLVLALFSGIYFSSKKAKKNNQKLFNKLTIKLLYQFSIPLICGGILSLIMLLHGQLWIIAPLTLIFYGLALINASKFTFEEIHYLGITEVILGIMAAIFFSNGLLFWSIGFGVAHIVYGIVLYNKYEKN